MALSQTFWGTTGALATDQAKVGEEDGSGGKTSQERENPSFFIAFSVSFFVELN